MTIFSGLIAPGVMSNMGESEPFPLAGAAEAGDAQVAAIPGQESDSWQAPPVTEPGALVAEVSPPLLASGADLSAAADLSVEQIARRELREKQRYLTAALHTRIQGGNPADPADVREHNPHMSVARYLDGVARWDGGDLNHVAVWTAREAASIVMPPHLPYPPGMSKKERRVLWAARAAAAAVTPVPPEVVPFVAPPTWRQIQGAYGDGDLLRYRPGDRPSEAPADPARAPLESWVRYWDADTARAAGALIGERLIRIARIPTRPDGAVVEAALTPDTPLLYFVSDTAVSSGRPHFGPKGDGTIELRSREITILNLLMVGQLHIQRGVGVRQLQRLGGLHREQLDFVLRRLMEKLNRHKAKVVVQTSYDTVDPHYAINQRTWMIDARPVALSE